MAFAPVQTVQASNTTANSQDVTITATTQGNLVWGFVPIYWNQSENLTSVTDDKGNTYVVLTAVNSDGGDGDRARLYAFYGMQVTGGTTVLTFSYSGSTLNKRPIVQEFSGFNPGSANADVYDTSATGHGYNVSNVSVSTLTPAAAGELIVAGVVVTNNVNFTAGSGFTLYGGTNPSPFRGQYKLVGGTSETAPISWDTYTLNAAEYAIAFKVGVPIVSGGGFYYMSV